MACVRINREFCKGCGLCVWVCNQDGLEVADELNELGVYPVQPVEDVKCTGCGKCALMCPEGGIEIDASDAEAGAEGDGPEDPVHADSDDAGLRRP